MRYACYRARNKKGFTLIERLAVIVIMAILAGILFPVFARARAKARQTAWFSTRPILAPPGIYPILTSTRISRFGRAEVLPTV